MRELKNRLKKVSEKLNPDIGIFWLPTLVGEDGKMYPESFEVRGKKSPPNSKADAERICEIVNTPGRQRDIQDFEYSQLT